MIATTPSCADIIRNSCKPAEDDRISNTTIAAAYSIVDHHHKLHTLSSDATAVFLTRGRDQGELIFHYSATMTIGWRWATRPRTRRLDASFQKHGWLLVDL